MRILSISTFSNAVQYYRHLVPNEALRRAGHTVDHYFFEQIAGDDGQDFAPFLYDNAKSYDLMHTGYMATETAIALMTATRNYADIPFITDLDDDIYNVPTYNPAFVHYHGGTTVRRVVRMHLRLSDAVSLSTDPLRDIVNKDSNHPATLPNCLDPHDWTDAVKRRRDNTRPCVMFAGNLGRMGDLEAVREGLESLMRSRDDVILVFMGCLPEWAYEWMPSETDPSKNRVFAVRACGSLPTYRHILNHVAPDVFINPIETNLFNKSKSHIKAFDAAMCGAALVCTDWTTNQEVPSNCSIKLDNTKTQWRDAIGALLDDKPMRERLNARLTEWAMDTQTIDKHIDKWVNLYKETIARGPIKDIDQIVRPAVGGGDGMERQGSGDTEYSGEASQEGGAPVRVRS